jgi:hypothetical protein
LTLHDAILAAAPALGVLALIFGPLAAWSADQRQRNPGVWLLFGALLGPIALVLLRASPPAQCWNCSESTVGFESRCAMCGADLRTSHPTAPAAQQGEDPQVAPPVLRSVPAGPSRPVSLSRRLAAERDQVPPTPLPDRLSALGAHRPDTSPALVPGGPDQARPEVTMLAMGVLVRASASLQPGSRYLIARTRDRLHIIGPIEASPEHVELDLPLAGAEANMVADRLVITGRSDGNSRRSFMLAFQAVVSMTGTPVDEAIMESAPPISIAAIRQ